MPYDELRSSTYSFVVMCPWARVRINVAHRLRFAHLLQCPPSQIITTSLLLLSLYLPPPQAFVAIIPSPLPLAPLGLGPAPPFQRSPKTRTSNSGTTMSQSTKTGSAASALSVRRLPSTGRAHSPPTQREVSPFTSITSLAHLIIIYLAFRGQSSRQSGNLTPRTVNSLSAIAGHDGDEEDWEREMRGFNNQDEVSYIYILPLPRPLPPTHPLLPSARHGHPRTTNSPADRRPDIRR
jgi:hypothetical protein